MEVTEPMSPDDLLGVVAVVDPDGVIRYVTPCVRRVLGHDPAGLVGRPALELVHPEDGDVARLASGPGRDPEGAAPIPLRVVHSDGSWRLLEVRVDDLHADPAVGGLLLSCRDVTRRQELAAWVQQAQQMRAVAEVTGRVAHEFNNLFTVMQGHVWRLGEVVPQDCAGVGELEALGETLERASVLTRQLLAYTRQQVLEPRVVDLAALVESMDDAVREAASSNVDVVRIGSEGQLAVRADPDQFERVVMELVANACAAMPGGGVLTVQVDRTELDDRAASAFPYAVLPGRYIRLVIGDTGTGMAPDVQARAFEPFFTMRAHRGHTGLGLSSIYGVVKQSGGYIWIESAMGVGTTVSVYLPEADSEVRTPSIDVQPREERGGPATVLVVEDNDAVRAMVVKVLMRSGFSVLEAADGEEALRLSAEYRSPIDLVVTDVMMPGMDGREMVARLRETRASVGVLFMSGYAREANMRPDIFGQDDLFIQKPFTPDVLVARVEAALQGAIRGAV
jgi:two-component system, cell cycle sensor histidine kinase and response regulator CckA